MSTAQFETQVAADLATEGDLPIYLRLRDSMLTALGQGLIKPGAKMPSERVFAEHLGISRVTVRKAVDLLCESGTLVRHQGAKTIVAPRLEKSVSKLTSFTDDMQSRGHQSGANWLSKSIARATPTEAMVLGLAQSAFVVRLDRVRLADGEPVALERAVVPQSVLPDLEQIGGSLYAALDAVGARPVRGTQRLRAVAATTKDAETLQCAVGAPLLCIERTCFSERGQCVEFTETRYLGSAYDFLTDLVQ